MRDHATGLLERYLTITRRVLYAVLIVTIGVVVVRAWLGVL